MMLCDYDLPVLNIGSEEMISINNLAKLIAKIANKNIKIKNVPSPEGVRGRNSDTDLLQESLGWKPSCTLEQGIEKLYPWILEQVENDSGMN